MDRIKTSNAVLWILREHALDACRQGTTPSQALAELRELYAKVTASQHAPPFKGNDDDFDNRRK